MDKLKRRIIVFIIMLLLPFLVFVIDHFISSRTIYVHTALIQESEQFFLINESIRSRNIR